MLPSYIPLVWRTTYPLSVGDKLVDIDLGDQCYCIIVVRTVAFF